MSSAVGVSDVGDWMPGGDGNSAFCCSDFCGIYVDECFLGVGAGEEFEGLVVNTFQGGWTASSCAAQKRRSS